MKHPSPIRARRCWPDEELQRRLRDLLILSGDPRATRATVSFGPALCTGARKASPRHPAASFGTALARHLRQMLWRLRRTR